MRQYRKRIETVYFQMEKVGVQRLHARTHLGFGLKAWASLLALAFTNIGDQQSRYIISNEDNTSRSPRLTVHD
jgi:hypothetical protein